MPTNDNPHAGQPALVRGPRPSEARLALIMVHGRGATAQSILTLADEFELEDVAYVAPQAAGHTWYPHSFLAPIGQNEPGISSGLAAIAAIVAALERDGIAADRIGLLGFSQGACLTLEYAARHARRYRGVFGLSGGLIGPPGTPRDYAGSLEGTPVLLGCSDTDPHIPLERVQESTAVLGRLGAAVDERIYPGMVHLVNADEIAAVLAILRA